MRIAYIHTGQWPSNSPSVTFVTMTAYALAQKFEHCYLFIQRNSNLSPEKILQKYFNIRQPDNLSIYQYKKSRLINSNHIYFLKVYGKIRKLIQDDKLDAVISRNSSFLPYLANIKKKYSIPTLYETHDFFVNLSIRDDINIRKKRKYSFYERHFIPKISGVICLQNCQKELYQKYFSKQNIFVVRTGVLQVKKTDISERKYLGYIGSFDNHKGIMDFFKATSMSETKPEILIIGGKNKREIEKLKSIGEKYYKSDKINITGWVNEKQLSKYLTTIKVGVIPLRDTFFNRYLTSPLKLFDFFSYGIPVIATELPTIKELVSENETGCLFKPNNIEDFSNKIDILFSNEEKYRQMVENIYKEANEYLWEERAEKIVSILSNIV